MPFFEVIPKKKIWFKDFGLKTRNNQNSDIHFPRKHLLAVKIFGYKWKIIYETFFEISSPK